MEAVFYLLTTLGSLAAILNLALAFRKQPAPPAVPKIGWEQAYEAELEARRRRQRGLLDL